MSFADGCELVESSGKTELVIIMYWPSLWPPAPGKSRMVRLRRMEYLSAILAIMGSSSPIWMPGTLVGIGLTLPRIFAGASGFGSNISCCGGPPGMKS